MRGKWGKALVAISSALRSNRLCWIGAAIGFASMLGFSWIHFAGPWRVSIPRGSPELMKLIFWNPHWNFGKLLAEAMPGAFLFLVGTILACVTYLGGLVQTLGFASILIVRAPANLAPYSTSHFDLGFYMALVSVVVVMASWGVRLGTGQVNAYHSRLAALSPRLALWSR